LLWHLILRLRFINLVAEKEPKEILVEIPVEKPAAVVVEAVTEVDGFYNHYDDEEQLNNLAMLIQAKYEELFWPIKRS
jgi:hypothetical protein